MVEVAHAAERSLIMPEQRIGVVTVTYNSGRVIDEFLQCLLAQAYRRFVLYVVDNASRDDTLEKVKALADSRIVLMENAQNLGFAAGVNLGIAAALESGCDSILIINNDTAFEPQLIEKLLAGMLEHGCQMAAPKILFYQDPSKIWTAGGAIAWTRGLRPKHFGYGQTDRGQFDKPKLVNFAPFCCTLISSDIFRLVGCLDSQYFVYFEDIDFMYRARRAGVKLVYLPNASLRHHRHALTGGPKSEFTIRQSTKNYFYFLLKHFGIWKSLPLLAANQVYFAARLLLGIDSPSVYRLKQASFREAFGLYRQWRIGASAPVAA